MKEIIKLGIILFSISFVAAIALQATEQVTAEPIRLQVEAANELARKAVMADADSFEALDEAKLSELKAQNDIIQEIFVAKKGSEILGYVVKTTPNGFAGAIEVVTGILSEGKLSGVRIGNNTETPGLGDLAKKPPFYEQYTGKSTSQEIGVAKSAPKDTEIQALTGATITSRAVTLGVNTAVKAIESIQ